MIVDLKKEIEDSLDKIGIDYILCENNKNLNVCFIVKKIEEDIIKKIYNMAPYIITKTFDGKFLFREDVQIYINKI